MDSHEVRSHWAGRTGEYSPAYYAHYGPDRTSENVRGILDEHVGREASVLELGCSSGRHLAHLQAHGYEDLAGIELNGDAFDVMAAEYPDLAEAGTFYHDAIEAVVCDLVDDRFDAVFSVETLQHLHPEAEWVLQELVRIAGELLVTVENEGDRVEDGAGGDADGNGATPSREGGDQSTDPDVNYVDDGLPLFYRDWNRVFTDLGLREVEARAGDRDTVRAFRAPGPAAER